MSGPRGNTAAIIASIAALALLAGCGGGGSAGSTVTVAATTASIPGAAGLQPQAGAPAFCSELAASQVVTGLGSALAGLAQNPPPADALASIGDAGKALADMQGDVPAQYSQAFSDAADSLEALASAPPGDSAAFTKTASALSNLGQEVQEPCGFPLG
jgi:hypothetical protein